MSFFGLGLPRELRRLTLPLGRIVWICANQVRVYKYRHSRIASQTMLTDCFLGGKLPRPKLSVHWEGEDCHPLADERVSWYKNAR